MGPQEGRAVSKIFISYRRSDTEIAAGRLGKDLRARFGDDAVFRDKESINAGADWTEAIGGAIGRQGLVLVLIGERWLQGASDGSRRIDDPADTHRREISAALESGCSVIPILVGDMRMPAEAELPENIRSLSRHNALKLRDDEWEGYDFPRLANEIARLGFVPINSGFKRLNLRAIVALGIGAAALIFYEMSDGDETESLAVAAMGILAILLAAWSCYDPEHRHTQDIGLAAGALVLGALAIFAAASG
jgi:TIR domain